MVRCTVMSCKSDSERKCDGVSFHSFPRDPEIRKLWIRAINKRNWEPPLCARICSKHFDKEVLLNVGKKNFLKPNSVPTKFLDSRTEEISPMEVDSTILMSMENLNVPCNSSSNVTPHLLKRKLISQQKVSQKRLKKLKALREKNRRLNKKVADLSNIILELKSKLLVSDENCELLSSIDTTNRDFLKKLLGPSKRKYSSSLRKFALCLHFISPAAYTFVRKTFNSCLPHPSTLRSWYKSIDGNPGFTKESLECVKVLASRAKVEGKNVYCALSIDEMAIRKHLQWDGKKCVGFVNFGEALEGDSVAIAKEALVFMLTAINQSWKIPVGYFLVDGCSGDQKANLVQQCIELLTECNVYVISVTFDGCPANFAMAKKLGCNLDANNIDALKTSFNIGDREVFITPDPAHMLKLVRNTLGEKKELTNLNNKKNSWEYIIKLHEIQANDGLYLANKLRSQHVNFAKQIMKVKLAAQTFSNSVAEAILLCKDYLGLSEFQDSEATVDFIKKINVLFDILNSRNFHTYGFEKPLNKDNFAEIQFFLNEMENYLIGLKLNGQPILSSNRKTGFFGFLICIRSIKNMFQNLIASGTLTFIPVYKLSQDHLECFFSAVRSRGGFNNNPTAIQFQSAYKRLIVHGEVKHITSGNCIPLDDIKILSYSETRHENKINLLTKLEPTSLENDFSENEPVIDNDHDYLADP